MILRRVRSRNEAQQSADMTFLNPPLSPFAKADKGRFFHKTLIKSRILSSDRSVMFVEKQHTKL
jgi:hypothetical protein